MSSREQAASLEGVWTMVRAELDGRAAPDLVVQNTVLELTQGEYQVRFRNEVMDRGQFEQGPEPTATLVLLGRAGPNAGRSIPCRYQLIGNRLRICYGLDGIPPNDFQSTAGGKRYLATYRRTIGDSSQAAEQ